MEAIGIHGKVYVNDERLYWDLSWALLHNIFCNRNFVFCGANCCDGEKLGFLAGIIFSDFQGVAFNLNILIFIDYATRQTTKRWARTKKSPAPPRSLRSQDSSFSRAPSKFFFRSRREPVPRLVCQGQFRRFISRIKFCFQFHCFQMTSNVDVLNKWHQQESKCEVCIISPVE